jgi:hypothetical protein
MGRIWWMACRTCWMFITGEQASFFFANMFLATLFPPPLLLLLVSSSRMSSDSHTRTVTVLSSCACSPHGSRVTSNPPPCLSCF